MFKIATWNVNSLRVRLPHVLQWLEGVKPDILALQETKLLDQDFPCDELRNAGYECLFSGQKSYNGVALLSKKSAIDMITEMPIFEDPQRRVLSATIDDIRIVNLYVPNGESLISPKFTYKLEWLKHLKLYLQDELQRYPKMIILGDFNIAPEPIDVHDPEKWVGKVLFSKDERDAFQDILALGFKDCFRIHHPTEKSYSWWDYRLNAFKRKLGLRIDHVLASTLLAQVCIDSHIDPTPRGWDRPSDHTPVVSTFNLQHF